MNFPSMKFKLDGKRLVSLSARLHPVLRIGRWLIWFFTLSEKDRIEAGIDVRHAREQG